MKKIAPFIILILLLVALVACNNPEVPSHLIQLPKESEQIGYSINFYGTTSSNDAAEGKYWTYEGENVKFHINADAHYTLANIIVKDNGKKVTLTDESDDYTERVSFEIKNVQAAHTITVEGVEILSFNVKLFKPKYAENENDKVGTIFNAYDDRFIIIKYDNVTYTSINQAINAINAKKITLGYDDSFEFWVGQQYPNAYHATLSSYLAPDDFNGIFGEKIDGSVERYEDMSQLSQVYYALDEGMMVQDGNLVKFEIAARSNINLYFDTLAFAQAKASYSIKAENCEVYDVVKVQPADTFFTYDTRWSFSIMEKITDGSVDYDNMKVYVNGEDVTDSKADGKFSFIGKPPSLFNAGNHTNYSEFEITVSGVEFVGEQDLVKIKLNHPTDVVSYGIYISYLHTVVDQNDVEGVEFLEAYYYEDGYTYFRKSDMPFAQMSINRMYDHSEMVIKVNGEEISDWEFLEEISDSYSSIYRVKFGEEYADEIIIDIEGLKLKEIEYKIKNSLSSEIDMYVEYNEQEQKVTSEITLNLVHHETFIIKLYSKNKGLTDISAYDIAAEDGLELKITASGTGTSDGADGVNSKDYVIEVDAFLDADSRTIDATK